MADWNARYLSEDTPWDQGGPSPLVLRLAAEHLTPPARLLVPGCGRGWEVEALAARGFEVTGLDLAPAAVEAARARIGDRPGVRLVAGDLLAPPGAEGADFDAVVEHTCFCALPPETWPRYVDAVADRLRPGGLLLGAFLHFEGGGPPFGTHPDEVRALFSPRFAIERLDPAEPFGPNGAPQLAAVFRRR